MWAVPGGTAMPGRPVTGWSELRTPSGYKISLIYWSRNAGLSDIKLKEQILHFDLSQRPRSDNLPTLSQQSSYGWRHTYGVIYTLLLAPSVARCENFLESLTAADTFKVTHVANNEL
ncbi:hypothetical protein EVAR_84854_1 [Eumeta japonica]|uniref:Uncharacterized protein n=1 Tax=Eumeta variegata TaxID=151549 RepID=A0A4C1Z5Y6_EUMVA|nr:hypothetical protein EVAR_84854_1 [Eumeta japonica]